MIRDIMFYFLIFLIYSIFGWLVEVVSIYINSKKIVNRGFLIGPYCPIYGNAALILILFFKDYFNNPIVLFMIVVFIASVIEYSTSYVMEKLFKARWWDYSEKSFNVNGRICLSISLLFGFLGIFIIYIINPPVMFLLNLIHPIVIIVLGSILMVVFILDVVVSFNVISKISTATTTIKKDYTEEISKKVKEFITVKSKVINKMVNRLIKAFPNVKR